MNINDKFKEILMQMVTQPVEPQIESALTDISWTLSNKVTPGYDSDLERMARKLVDQADRGDIRAINKICDIIGKDEWRP